MIQFENKQFNAIKSSLTIMKIFQEQKIILTVDASNQFETYCLRGAKALKTSPLMLPQKKWITLSQKIRQLNPPQMVGKN